MNDSMRKKKESGLRIKQNEETIGTLRAELERLEAEEDELGHNNRQFLRVTCDCEGWKGPAADRFRAQLESELMDTFASCRREFASRQSELEDSVKRLRRKNESLWEEVKRQKEEK